MVIFRIVKIWLWRFFVVIFVFTHKKIKKIISVKIKLLKYDTFFMTYLICEGIPFQSSFMNYTYKRCVDSLSVTVFSPFHSQVTNMTSIRVCYPRTRHLRLWQRCREVWFVRVSSCTHVRLWKPLHPFYEGYVFHIRTKLNGKICGRLHSLQIRTKPENPSLTVFAYVENPNGFQGVNNHQMSSVYIHFIHWDNTERLINDYTI